MKTNYFYATLTSELAALCRAAAAISEREIAEQYDACKELHRAFCLRLFRDFVTPSDRGDLYDVSASILSLFLPLMGLFSCSEGERGKISRSAELFLPLRFDASALRFTEDLASLWGSASCSVGARNCRMGFESLAHSLIRLAVNNV